MGSLSSDGRWLPWGFVCLFSLGSSRPAPIQLGASADYVALCGRQKGKEVFGIIGKLELSLMIRN